MDVQIEVTTRCNFGCFYCAGRDMQQQDMSLEQYLSILDNHVARYGVPRQISLQGEGEPTLNKAFFEMAAYARRIGSEPLAITNGTYKHPEHFADSFPTVGVTVDTLDPKEAERIGRYNLPRVLEFVAALDRMVRVLIFSVALSPSVHGVAAWCRQRGLKHIVQPLQEKPDYQYRYPQLIPARRVVKRYACNYLERNLMRYYAIDSTELPCCFIKDVSQYASIDDLQQQLSAGRVPHGCKGCRYLV